MPRVIGKRQPTLAERLANRRMWWLASITGSEARRVELPHPR
jgi:hypothetical protein